MSWGFWVKLRSEETYQKRCRMKGKTETSWKENLRNNIRKESILSAYIPVQPNNEPEPWALKADNIQAFWCTPKCFLVWINICDTDCCSIKGIFKWFSQHLLIVWIRRYKPKKAYFQNFSWFQFYVFKLRGYCTPDQFCDCLCIYLKNYNTFMTSKICFL